MDDFNPEHWRDLYVMLGTSSAALLGLLFVATSLHVVDLAKNSGYGTRALYNTYFLLLTLVEAACILMPQSSTALGAEIAIANLFLFLMTFKVVFRYVYQRRDLGKRGGYSDYRSATFLLAFLAGAIGGTLLFCHDLRGLYVVTAAYIVVLIAVALNSWSIMRGIGEVDRAAERRAAKQHEQ